MKMRLQSLKKPSGFGRLFYEGDHSEFTEVLLGMGSTLKNLGRLDEASETYTTRHSR